MSDTSFQAPSPEHLAELLPQFEIDFFIAQGGMGAVYKGRQRSLDRDIAVKVLPKEVGANEEFRESFNTEAKAMAKLNHPNLLGVFDFGSVDGMPYIVMEYVEGGSLYEACFEQAVDPKQAVTIVKGICDGLANAHEHDIVHRDIKPANILLTEKIEPKVADFGLAQAVDSDQPGLVMGTPGYTAPEVFQDPEQAGKLADIYSVGVILHQLLTGIDPSGSMEPPSKPTGNLRLDAIWRKAANAVPTQRYATVDAMAKDLEKWLSASSPQAAAGGSAPYRPPSAPVGVGSTSGGGGIGMKILLIAVLLVGVLVVFQVLQKRKGDIEKKNADNAANPKIKVVEVDSGPIENEQGVNEPEVGPTDADGEIAANDSGTDSRDTDMPDEEDDNPTEFAGNDTDQQPDLEVEPEVEPDKEAEDIAQLAPGDPELLTKAIELIEKVRGERNADLAENTRWFTFQLGVQKRDAEFDDARAIENIEAAITETRIPPFDVVEIVPPKVYDDFRRALEKEEAIDEKHRSALEMIRDPYVTRLRAAAEESTDDQLKRQLNVQADRAENLDDWIGLLSPDPDQDPKKVADAFVGKWNSIQRGREAKWIALPEGRMEVVGETWVGRWIIVEDGKLEVYWRGNRKKEKIPYTFEKVGRNWVGKTTFGKDMTLTPGDW